MQLDGAPLGKLLRTVESGEIQLPDFQREWKWDDERIRSLLATVTLEYPLGVVMTLETGGEAQFKARPLAGTAVPADADPAQLLLDGQQRLTSLYQALLSRQPVRTSDVRGKEISRFYYIDIRGAVDPAGERDEAILSVPPDRVLRTDFNRGITLDLSSREKECERGFFPLNLVFNVKETFAWQTMFVQSTPDGLDLWPAFQEQVLQPVNRFSVPLVKLPKQTRNEAVCAVFEKVNTGGVVLNVFELLTATYAGNRAYKEESGAEFSLRADWARISGELGDACPVLKALESLDFLQALALIVSYRRRQDFLARNPHSRQAPPAVGCKRKDLLALPLNAYREHAQTVTGALAWAGEFLRTQHVFRPEDLPYRTQLAPLAAIRAILGERADTPEAQRKIVQWYWCGVFGELYGGTTESRIAKDVEQVTAWVDGGGEPDTVLEASFSAQRLRTMTSRLSAAYKGVFARLLARSCYDWRSGELITAETLVEDAVDFRQVFPKGWFERSSIKDERMTSVVNKTPLSAHTYRTVVTRSPAAYLEVLDRDPEMRGVWVDDRVESHLIDPKTLRAADFEAFYQDRSEQLLGLIEEAMGKLAAQDVAGPATATAEPPAGSSPGAAG
ncbi:DUF262 domain-containing protein [Pseudofrankia sp. BMG5.36]|uniref:DUF262 domain-containing protein n=1 Tax=Pseudofrankia sp. BMG5.36 TaxID=1834512 RepID=UPI0008D981ED|nr:DUF262 domain-containing protein [Pseudofrankia sp. BMG5.36]OHV69570.1 hypothetical protein BCD48_34770 [Pseudofrankia sp. BMG5.36]